VAAHPPPHAYVGAAYGAATTAAGKVWLVAAA
jgi:hypothetical protein